MAAKLKLKSLQPLLEGKLDDLKRKLSDVEYVSSSLSREIISLRTSVQKSHPTNKSASPLSLPNIFAFLPHLVAQPEGLIPEMHVGTRSDRRGIDLIFVRCSNHHSLHISLHLHFLNDRQQFKMLQQRQIFFCKPIPIHHRKFT